MKIIDIAQGTQEWLEWRNGGIGASDIAAIIGISPFKTALQLYEEKSGLFIPKGPNDFMLRGTMYESEARNKFEQQHEGVFEPICCESEENPIFKASLDGYNIETNEILEIKIPGRKTIDLAKDGIIPEHYKSQMDWQMLATGAKGAYYCAETAELYSTYCQRDDIAIEKLKTAANEFWRGFQIGVPPPLQKGDYIEIDDPEFIKLADKYIDLSNQIKNLEASRKELKSKIIDFGDDGNFLGGNLKCTKVPPRITYDIQKMIDAGIDVEPFRKTSSNAYYRIAIA